MDGSMGLNLGTYPADNTPTQTTHLQVFYEWARVVSNHRPLACEASALPLSYVPSAPDSIGVGRGGGVGGGREGVAAAQCCPIAAPDEWTGPA
jgi:hypothetical protein